MKNKRRKLTPKEKEEAFHSYVHPPVEGQNAFVELGRQLYGTKGISAGSAMLDHFMIETRPGWSRTWVARSGEGKSTILRIIAKREAERLIRENRTETHYVAFITYEEAVDSQELHFQEKNGLYTNDEFWRGKVDVDKIIKSSTNRPNLPIWWFGESFLKTSVDSPPMSMEVCLENIREVYRIFKMRPSVIILDYVQKIVIENSTGNRRNDVAAVMLDFDHLLKQVGCPGEVGAQAKQLSITKKPWPIPDQYDVEEAYAVSQISTSVVGMWRVWNTHKDDEKADEYGVKLHDYDQSFPLDPKLAVLRPSKQRPNFPKRDLPVLIDTENLRILDIKDLTCKGEPLYSR